MYPYKFYAKLAGAAALAMASAVVSAQDVIKIGELNSYKTQPAFLGPYKKGMELAIEQINAAGGVNGKSLQLITRDDNSNQGDAVGAAEELLTRDKEIGRERGRDRECKYV